MSDIRLSFSLPTHPKTKKLIRRLGAGAAWHLVCLFMWAGQNRSSGDLSGLDDLDIELAVDYAGEEGTFVAALLDVGFLKGAEKSRYINGWAEHNPWAANAEKRSKVAKENIAKRWEKRLNGYESNTDGIAPVENGNTPYPYPLPNPSPNPTGDSKESLVGNAVANVCPQAEIRKVYAEVLPELVQPRVWTGNNEANLRKRWREEPERQTVDWWRRWFQYVRQSDFLMGRSGGKPFQASLAWLVKPENFAKVTNGNYH